MQCGVGAFELWGGGRGPEGARGRGGEREGGRGGGGGRRGGGGRGGGRGGSFADARTFLGWVCGLQDESTISPVVTGSIIVFRNTTIMIAFLMNKMIITTIAISINFHYEYYF